VIFSGCRVAGAAVAKLAYAVGLKSTGVFPVVGSSPTSRTISERIKSPLIRGVSPTIRFYLSVSGILQLPSVGTLQMVYRSRFVRAMTQSVAWVVG
jgi:hypothetical protein